MVTGRDAFPSVSVGIGGSQKVELRSPRPALMYVYRAAAALPFIAQAQESVRRVAHICGQKAGGACSPLMRRGVFSVNFAAMGGSKRGVPLYVRL